MVAASSVQVGDFIADRGVVTNVRYFASPVASNNRSNISNESAYYQHVSNEVNSCYSWVVDRVVIETTSGTYGFMSDTLVSVASRNVLRAAA